jgi:hypothetical protein
VIGFDCGLANAAKSESDRRFDLNIQKTKFAVRVVPLDLPPGTLNSAPTE